MFYSQVISEGNASLAVLVCQLAGNSEVFSGDQTFLSGPEVLAFMKVLSLDLLLSTALKLE